MMDTSELEEAFKCSLQEVNDDPEGFVICYMAGMSSMLMLRAAMLAIIDNPARASEVAEYALKKVEDLSPQEIAKLLGMSSFGETVN